MKNGEHTDTVDSIWRQIYILKNVHRYAPKYQRRISRINKIHNEQIEKKANASCIIPNFEMLLLFYFRYIDMPTFSAFDRIGCFATNIFYGLKNLATRNIEIRPNIECSFDNLLFLIASLLSKQKRNMFEANLAIFLPSNFLKNRTYAEILAFQWLECRVNISYEDSSKGSSSFYLKLRAKKRLVTPIQTLVPNSLSHSQSDIFFKSNKFLIRACKSTLPFAIALKSSLLRNSEKLILLSLGDLSHLSHNELNKLKTITACIHDNNSTVALLLNKNVCSTNLPIWLEDFPILEDSNWSMDLRTAILEIADCNILTGADMEAFALLNKKAKCLKVSYKCQEFELSTQLFHNKLTVRLASTDQFVDDSALKQISNFCL